MKRQTSRITVRGNFPYSLTVSVILTSRCYSVHQRLSQHISTLGYECKNVKALVMASLTAHICFVRPSIYLNATYNNPSMLQPSIPADGFAPVSSSANLHASLLRATCSLELLCESSSNRHRSRAGCFRGYKLCCWICQYENSKGEDTHVFRRYVDDGTYFLSCSPAGRSISHLPLTLVGTI